jgi:hypothetical protein
VPRRSDGYVEAASIDIAEAGAAYVECQLEQSRSLLEGEAAHGLLAGLLDSPRRKTFIPLHSGDRPVAREVKQVVVELACVEFFDGLGSPAVKADAFGRPKASLDGIANQGMEEAMGGGGRADLNQACGDSLV